MTLVLVLLVILILIGVVSLLETVRQIEVRTRSVGDSEMRIELELEEIKKMVKETREKA